MTSPSPPNAPLSPEAIAELGLVGAGGAGFPTHVKLQAKADTFLLNAAECEPLLHKDKELLVRYTAEVLEGIRMAAGLVGAQRAVIGIKEKYRDLTARLRAQCPKDIEVQPLRDTYPAGDEQVMIFDVTGRIVPPGGLPLHVGCIVNNVETMLNLARRRPVTHKYLTVAGAVAQPVTLRVPLGVTLGEVVAAAGGATVPEYDLLLGGVMMGRLPEQGLDTPVTKTTGGVYVFPKGHPVMRRYLRSVAAINRINRSACDQCTFCTELCPRYLLGHPIEPHKAMRAAGFLFDEAPALVGTAFCCECNVCTMIACPEDLDPKSACVQGKARARELGLKWQGDPAGVKAHPMGEGRRVPIQRLMTKLGLNAFRNEGALREETLDAARVRILLKQHVGAPCQATVKPGDAVREGDVVGRPPEGQLGVPVHASLTGVVEAVADTHVDLRRA